MKIIVWEWILKIPLSYIVKTDGEILPRAEVADDSYKISYKLLEPLWPERHSRFGVSILIFPKCGNAVWVHQERCWAHLHLPKARGVELRLCPCPWREIGSPEQQRRDGGGLMGPWVGCFSVLVIFYPMRHYFMRYYLRTHEHLQERLVSSRNAGLSYTWYC